MDEEGTSSPPETEPRDSRLASKQEMKREAVEFVKMIAWFLVLFFVIKTYVIEGYEVQGPSMIPTLTDRERILVLKLPHTLSQFRVFSGINAIEPGDIVVFDSPVEPNKRYVKRVIARGVPETRSNTVAAQQANVNGQDESVRVRYDRGKIYVNNKRISEDYLPTTAEVSDDSLAEVRLGPGRYYVLGDNRGVSKDSRSFGPVEDDRVIGKAVLCFWPLSKFRILL